MTDVTPPTKAATPPAPRKDVPGVAPIAPVPAECPKHPGRLLDEVIEIEECNLGFEHRVLVGRRCVVDGDSYDLDGNVTERPVPAVPVVPVRGPEFAEPMTAEEAAGQPQPVPPTKFTSETRASKPKEK